MVDSSSLAAAARAIVRSCRLLERAVGAISLSDYRILSALAEGEGRASRLAARLALGKPAVSASVESLGRRGLLLREGVPGDSRSVHLALTAEGQDALDRAEEAMAARLGAVLEHAEDPVRLAGALAELGAALGAVPSARAGGGR